MLAKNTSLKYLSLFSNKADVDGARAIGQSLKVNSSLVFLDMGSNRIRNKGMQALSEGIKSNPNISLIELGVRWNFVTDDGIILFLENLLQN